MKQLLLSLLLFCSLIVRSQDQTYLISRYEQTGDQLFICISSLKTPSYVEHFFTNDEKADSTAVKITIAGLIAQLQVADSIYVPPTPTIDRLKRAKKYQIDPSIIKAKRRQLNKGQPKINNINSVNSAIIDSILNNF